MLIKLIFTFLLDKYIELLVLHPYIIIDPHVINIFHSWIATVASQEVLIIRSDYDTNDRWCKIKCLLSATGCGT